MLKKSETSVRIVNFIRKSAILRNSEVNNYYRSIFDECDTNKDGTISISELREFIARCEENEIPEEVIEFIHTRFDKNQDKQLDFPEFLDLINHPTVISTFKRVGSSYIKYIGVSSVKRTSLKLKRTVTNTGLYEEEFTFKKHTVCMLLLSVVQILLYFIDKMYRKELMLNVLEYDPTKKYQAWRYITYILVHEDLFHLLGNVLIQIVIGIPLEIIHSWRVPVIYVISAIGGCMTHSIVEGCKRGVIGGSGGLYSFYTAHIAVVLLNWREMSHPVISLLIFGILTICDAILNYTLHKDKPGRVSYITHLGGAIVGFLLGILILRNLRETKIEKIVWKLSLVGFTALMTSLIVLNVQQKCEIN